MDFVRLGPVYSADYIPDTLIEGYNSLVWAERHTDPGEFELKSYDVDRIAALLPENSLVSHLETEEVMLVESHSIEMVGEGVDARPEITVKGRDATLILDHRFVDSTYQYKRSMRQAYSTTGAACVLLWQAVDNNTGKDVTRGDTAASTPEGNDYNWNTLDDIPNCIVTEAVANEGAARWFYLEQGALLPQLTNILAQGNLGIRCLRPVLPNNKIVISVDSALATRGTIRRTPTDNIQALCFEVYDGIDRSDSVQFSMLQGHILDPTYFTSIQSEKTVANMMYGGGVAVADTYRPGEEGLSGWQRRSMPFDAGNLELPAAPTRPTRPKSSATKAQKAAYETAMDRYIDAYAAWVNKRNAMINNFRTASAQAALAELNQAKKTNVFSGDISDLSPYKYKVHYGLGDVVSLIGDYGKSSKMVVHEYVRTEDATGDRGFPGLVAL